MSTWQRSDIVLSVFLRIQDLFIWLERKRLFRKDRFLLGILPFLLVLPFPWQQMHQGETWVTHGWHCTVTQWSRQGMIWRCNPPGMPTPSVISPQTTMQPLPTTSTPSILSGQPCQQSDQWSTFAGSWSIPPGCYAGVYWMGYGDCYGWVNHLRDVNRLSIIAGPSPGVVIHLAGGVQGASPSGHWVYVMSVRWPWMLISEENMYWRGGGYNKVTYRYMYVSGGMTFYG